MNRTSKRPWDVDDDPAKYPVPWNFWTYAFDTSEGHFVILQQSWNHKKGVPVADMKPLNPRGLPAFTQDECEAVFAECEARSWPLKAGVVKALRARRAGEADIERVALSPEKFPETRAESPDVASRRAAEAVRDVEALIADAPKKARSEKAITV